MEKINKIILSFVVLSVAACASKTHQVAKNQEFEGLLFKNMFFKESPSPVKKKEIKSKRGLASAETKKTVFDGMWQFDRVDCPKDTELSPEMNQFKRSDDMFAQFILENGKFIMRMTETKKEEGQLKKCVFRAVAEFKVENENIKLSDSKNATMECNGITRKVASIYSDTTKVFVRKGDTGLEELVVPNQGGCNPYGGDVVLKKLPLK